MAVLEQDLLGCECDDCQRKRGMLQGLLLAVACGAQPASLPILDELRADLRNHGRKAARADDESAGDRSAILGASELRPWLAYDPDALLPSKFDVFLLSGSCPAIRWQALEQPMDENFSLCYVVGCGRSGTTCFAELLSCYEDVVFLNEPRQLWIPMLPSIDVWSAEAPRREGRLCFEASEALAEAVGEARSVGESACEAYRDILRLTRPPDASELTPRGHRVIVEKFPEHAFRLSFLETICAHGLGEGKCAFIHLVRDGVAVARSIARFASSSAWYGVREDWKWRQIRSLLKDSGPAKKLPEAFEAMLDASDTPTKLFARGLVEWALSVNAARLGAQAVGAPCLEIRYEDLLADPASALEAAEVLLRLDRSETARQAASSRLRAPAAGAGTAATGSESEAAVLRALSGSWLEAMLQDSAATAPSPGLRS